MLNNYNSFLFETLKVEMSLLLEDSLYTSDNFLSRLKSLSKFENAVGNIARSLIKIIKDKIDNEKLKQNYYDLTNVDDIISFIPANKIPNNLDLRSGTSPYKISGRGEIKVGRIIRNLCDIFNITASTKDIEEFVNAFKSCKSDLDKEFRLVNGDNIAKFYKIENYFSGGGFGSLGLSCMAEKKNKIFKIYTENTKKVQLLILIDKNEKIHGRALVWKLSTSPCEAKYLMDRIYTNSDSDVYKFKQFAIEKGFLYKKYNHAYIVYNVNFSYKEKDIFGECTVKVDGDFKNYPFIDTMCFLNNEKDQLSNIPSKNCYFLHSTEHECEKCEGCKGDVILSKNPLSFCDMCGSGVSFLHRQKIDNSYSTWINKKYKN